MRVSMLLDSPSDLLVGLWEANRGCQPPGSREQEGAVALEKVEWVSHLPFLVVLALLVSFRWPPSTNQDALLATFFVVFMASPLKKKSIANRTLANLGILALQLT